MVLFLFVLVAPIIISEISANRLSLRLLNHDISRRLLHDSAQDRSKRLRQKDEESDSSSTIPPLAIPTMDNIEDVEFLTIPPLDDIDGQQACSTLLGCHHGCFSLTLEDDSIIYQPCFDECRGDYIWDDCPDELLNIGDALP